MAENEMLTDVPLTQIRDFLHHPYLVKDDESMDELVESIKERGLIQPVIIRPVEDGMYEMVSGHRRKRAFEIAGCDKIPARVKEMSRAESNISSDPVGAANALKTAVNSELVNKDAYVWFVSASAKKAVVDGENRKRAEGAPRFWSFWQKRTWISSICTHLSPPRQTRRTPLCVLQTTKRPRSCSPQTASSF